MAINVGGLVSIIVFYLVILAVGIWAGWKHGKKDKKETGTESVMLAGRNMGVFVGIMTMTGILYVNINPQNHYTCKASWRVITFCFPINNESNSHLGRRRIHHGIGRSGFYQRRHLVSGAVWLRCCTFFGCVL